MSNLPRISIVTPSYNDFQYLERTILSVLSQNYPNLEYIIIDGGSNDGSIEIIKKYEDKLTYWTSEPDEGMYYALQKGFIMSTGEIMGWINSDDMLHTNSLFTIGQLFNDYRDIKWVQGIPNIVDEHDRVVFVSPRYEVDKLFFYKKKHANTGIYIQQESTFWCRSLWNKAGGYISTEYKYASDFELWIRFFQHEKLYNISALIGSFRWSNSGQASVENSSSYLDETLTILDQYTLSENEKKQIRLTLFFEKLESYYFKVKTKIFKKMQLNKHYVENEKLHFDNKLQKFHLIK